MVIPPAVRAELERHPHAAARLALESAIHEGWIQVMPLADAVPNELVASLDLGEAEALALARETKA